VPTSLELQPNTHTYLSLIPATRQRSRSNKDPSPHSIQTNWQPPSDTFFFRYLSHSSKLNPAMFKNTLRFLNFIINPKPVRLRQPFTQLPSRRTQPYSCTSIWQSFHIPSSDPDPFYHFPCPCSYSVAIHLFVPRTYYACRDEPGSSPTDGSNNNCSARSNSHVSRVGSGAVGLSFVSQPMPRGSTPRTSGLRSTRQCSMRTDGAATVCCCSCHCSTPSEIVSRRLLCCGILRNICSPAQRMELYGIGKTEIGILSPPVWYVSSSVVTVS